MDSGWLSDSDFSKEFAPVQNYKENYEEYYTVENKGDRLVFTVTDENGLSLVVNNNADGKAAMMLNDVIIDRAD